MTANDTRMPVYFFSHGGPNVQYDTEHPVYPILQSIGREITQRVQPKAVIVVSAHWQHKPNEVAVNNAAGETPLIYDFYGFPSHYYEATFPTHGSPRLASQIQQLLLSSQIPTTAFPRGIDHGVFSGFNVAFPPKSNPLDVPLVQVSLFDNEDPHLHYRLGAALAPLRDQGVLIICTGMTGHNLQDFRAARGQVAPRGYIVSFDEALRQAVESEPSVREERMAEAVRRKDAREAHPTMDHLMPVYVAAGAAGQDYGRRTWTLHEWSMGWGQYRFGDVPE